MEKLSEAPGTITRPQDHGGAVDETGSARLAQISTNDPALATFASALRLVRTETRPAEVAALENAIVSFFVEAAELVGVPNSVAAIYGICFASPEPLSFADINERLNISQGSVSQGLRVLREMGALRVVEAKAASLEPRRKGPTNGQAGARNGRDYYSPDLELRKLATHFIEVRLEKQVKTGQQRLHAIKKLVPTPNNEAASGFRHEHARELKARLNHLQSWHDKGRALVPIMKGFLKLG